MIYIVRLFAAQFFPRLFWSAFWTLPVVLTILCTLPANDL